MQKKLIRFLIMFICLILSLTKSIPVSAQEIRQIKVIFLHHSCGQNLIEEGQVREELTGLGYEFFDHGYNGDGLRLPDGTWTGGNFDVPDDNTDPDGLAEIFSQPLLDPPDNTFSLLMQYDVIVFKSCFPVSNIGDDGQLAAYRSHYLSIRDTVDQYPEKLFVVVTQPPQVPNNTDDDEAQRARMFTDWLASDEYLEEHPNLVTFNFFDLLANEDHVLRSEYRVDPWDAHPNEAANREIGPVFVDFLDTEIRDYFSTIQLPAEDAEPVLEEEALPVAIGNSTDEYFDKAVWYADTDGITSSIACSLDSSLFMVGENSLYVNYAVGTKGYASCANQFSTPLDWSDGKGVQFYLRSDRAGQDITLLLYSGSLNEPVPFGVHFVTPDASVDSWDGLAFSWAEFTKLDWFGEGGIARIDPANIISVIFSLESEDGTQGQFWVDGLSLIDAESQDVPMDEDLTDDSEEIIPEDDDTGRLCPLSTVVMPLLVGFVWVMHSRRKSGKEYPKISRLD